jgi:hypothetical protein
VFSELTDVELWVTRLLSLQVTSHLAGVSPVISGACPYICRESKMPACER